MSGTTRLSFSTSRRSVCISVIVLLVALSLFASACGSSGTSGSSTSASGPRVELVVSAAADLSPVLEELVPVFEKQTGMTVKTNIGSTGQLTEQITAGAKVDVFLAASKAAVDQLAAKSLLVAGSEQQYARGRLVLWTRPGSKVTAKNLQDLTNVDVKRVSLANPDHAPYGQAAKQALQSAGLWDQLQPKLVPAENVLQAFQFASTGNTDVALVALSLVAEEKGTYTLVPEELHQPINQTLAIPASSTHQEQAKEFVAFLTGGGGRDILKKYGFTLPDGG